jgi:putative membrane-bound dehydrogenase-like protein
MRSRKPPLARPNTRSAALLTIVLVCGWAWPAGAEPFPQPTNSEPAERGSPPPAATAAATIALPPGFTATVMAAEPDVQNPIALAWDHRGRLWVAENYTYAERTKRFDLALRDRVLIFTDTDGDGVFDDRRVFVDSVQMLTGIEVGHGGVWLMCPPRLLFIPDRDRDDVPDGPAETILDGFEVAEANYHNFANGLRFGPDGWLYGRCGHACPARIGPPGSPAERRLPMHGGLWRYSPRTGRVEVLTVGTTNPWGHDWRAEGEGFFVNTVNGHLWHLIPGAHFRQPIDNDPNPHAYQTIDHHADHFHFDTGAGWQKSRDGSATDLGGGHAHAGCMIYAGTNWPTEYRGRLFTLNFHGRRVNQEILERAGSGYVAHHGRDLCSWKDPWFRGMELASGPDGSVVVLDWSDTGECHEHDGVHRTSGRIYRLAHGQPRLPPPFKPGFDLARLPDGELARVLRHADGWWVAQARVILAERAAAGPLDTEAIAILREQFAAADALAAADPLVSAAAHRARALIGLSLAGRLEADDLLRQLDHPDEHVRTWAIRLLTDSWPIDAMLGPVPFDAASTAAVAEDSAALMDRFVTLAGSDSSGLVRLTLASTLQRLPVSLRPRLAAALVARGEDAADHNLPLLVWYGLIPVADADPDALVDVAAACRWPTTRRLITRRLAGFVDSAPAVVDRLLLTTVVDHSSGPDAGRVVDTLAGLADGLAGWRRAPRPASWGRVTAAVAALPKGDAADRSRRLADEISVVFGDGRALAAVRDLALDSHAAADMRKQALATLMEARPPDLHDICNRLLADRIMQGEAARGLALFDDSATASLLVEAGRRAQGADREAILSALASRRSFAGVLLDAVEQERLAAGNISAAVVRQVHALGDPHLSERVTAAWGQLRESPAEKRQQIRQLTAVVNATPTGTTDLGAGRIIFQKTCGNCHRLYGEGGQVGPDLTGSGRHDLGYLLENIVDPSAVVNREWRISIVSLSDGRVLTGVVLDRNERTVIVQGVLDRQTIPIEEIDEITPTDRSPMPDGLLDQLTERQIVDLIAYLRHPVQVPLSE